MKMDDIFFPFSCAEVFVEIITSVSFHAVRVWDILRLYRQSYTSGCGNMSFQTRQLEIRGEKAPAMTDI